MSLISQNSYFNISPSCTQGCKSNNSLADCVPWENNCKGFAVQLSPKTPQSARELSMTQWGSLLVFHLICLKCLWCSVRVLFFVFCFFERERERRCNCLLRRRLPLIRCHEFDTSLSVVNIRSSYANARVTFGDIDVDLKRIWVSRANRVKWIYLLLVFTLACPSLKG